jgi:hypothetical protein
MFPISSATQLPKNSRPKKAARNFHLSRNPQYPFLGLNLCVRARMEICSSTPLLHIMRIYIASAISKFAESVADQKLTFPRFNFSVHLNA